MYKIVKNPITWIVGLLIPVAFGASLALNPALVGQPVQAQNRLVSKTSPEQESLFAQIDEDGNVLRTIVITQELIDTGKWGDPDTWVAARQRGRKEYASQGDKIDLQRGFIIKPKPAENSVFNEENGRWVTPVNQVTASSTR